ncbi:hypothetical protein BJX64DRAFT_13693 [Aspergillus heterothallicus]
MIPFLASICSSQKNGLATHASVLIMLHVFSPPFTLTFSFVFAVELDGCMRKKRMIRHSAGTWLWKCDLGCLAGQSALAILVVTPTCELCRFVDKLSYMLFDLCSPFTSMTAISPVLFLSFLFISLSPCSLTLRML